MPKWGPGNLEYHWDLRVKKDRPCISGAIGKTSPTKEDYEQLSQNVYRDHCIAYSAQEKDPSSGEYRERCNYYADERVVRVITDEIDEAIITCYHWHKGGCNIRNNREHPSAAVSRYRKSINNLVQSDRIKELKWMKE
jgi:hypothetical protein